MLIGSWKTVPTRIGGVVLSLCLACLMLAGCASTRNSTAQIPSPTATVPLLACQTSQLTLMQRHLGVAMENVAVEFHFENHSQDTCTLEGYPGMQLLDANQRPLPTHQQQTTLAFLFTAQPPHLVILAPSGNAYFVLEWHDVTLSGQPCSSYSSFVQVTPAPNQPAILAASATNACNGEIITSPIESTDAGL